MKSWTFWGAVVALVIAAFAGSVAWSQDSGPSLTLYEKVGLQGRKKVVTTTAPDLAKIAPTLDNFAWSLQAKGRWEVCMDRNHRAGCRVVEGDVRDLGLDGGAITSVRPLGSTAATPPPVKPTAKGAPKSTAAADEWRPMERTDLFGGDYREFHLTAGQDWRVCKAACDKEGQCRSWTNVLPGRTPHGECFLKNEVPSAQEAECCISGVKGAASAASMPRAVPGAAPASRLGQRVGDAAEQKVGEVAEGTVRRAIGGLLGDRQ